MYGHREERGVTTFLKEKLQGQRFIMCKAARRIVMLRVFGHELEIRLKCKSVFVHASFDFGGHSAQVHRFLDNLEVAVPRMNKMDKDHGIRLTVVHYPEQGRQVD